MKSESFRIQYKDGSSLNLNSDRMFDEFIFQAASRPTGTDEKKIEELTVLAKSLGVILSKEELIKKYKKAKNAWKPIQGILNIFSKMKGTFK